MGEGQSLTGLTHRKIVQFSAASVLLLFALFFYQDGQAMSADESVLRERLPVAIKVTTPDARSRIRHWRTFIESVRHQPMADKLTAVNNYFNALRFIEDINLWRRTDYWATPLQVLAAGAGDCEDIAIAKYFTFKALGVSNEHLRITYVWNSGTRSGNPEAHMVLTYMETAYSEPLILDILTNDIQTQRQRTDLEPVYSINSDGLWLVGDNSRQILAGSPAQLSQWRQLSQAMESDAVLLRMQ